MANGGRTPRSGHSRQPEAREALGARAHGDEGAARRSLTDLPEGAISKIIAAVPSFSLADVRLTCRTLQRHANERLCSVYLHGHGALSQRRAPLLTRLLASGALPNASHAHVYEHRVALTPGQIERLSRVLSAWGVRLSSLEIPSPLLLAPPLLTAVRSRGLLHSLHTLRLRDAANSGATGDGEEEGEEEAAAAPRLLSDALQLLASSKLPALRALHVDVCICNSAREVMEDAAWHALGRLTQLTSLGVHADYCVPMPPGVAALQAGVEVQSSTLAQLAPRLASLHVHNASDELDLSPLTGLTNLFVHVKPDVAAFPRGLSMLTNLRVFRAIGSVAGTNYAPLFAPLRQLQKLELSSCMLHSDLARALSACPGLSEMHFRGAVLTEAEGGSDGARLAALRRLTFEDSVSLTVPLFAVAPALEELEFQHKIGRDAPPLLLIGLVGHQRLRRLSLNFLHLKQLAAHVDGAQTWLSVLFGSLPALQSLQLDGSGGQYPWAMFPSVYHLSLAEAAVLRQLPTSVVSVQLSGLSPKGLASLNILTAAMPQLRDVTISWQLVSATQMEEEEQEQEEKDGCEADPAWLACSRPWVQAVLALAALPRLQTLTMGPLPGVTGGCLDDCFILLRRLLDVLCHSSSLRRVVLDTSSCGSRCGVARQTRSDKILFRMFQDLVREWHSQQRGGRRGDCGYGHVIDLQLRDPLPPRWDTAAAFYSSGRRSDD